jgi:Fur family ferric uptake transcriptional regulator/Fur family peroxide stress response transcriptional regulator
MTESELQQVLRDGGRRVTPQRILIHRAVGELDRHASAGEVLERVSASLPNASLPTVYATLELFEELGTVRRVSSGGGPTLWDPRTDDHGHTVCQECGAVEDLDSGIDTERLLRSARRRGFQASSAELVVSGLCARCAA